MLLLRDLFDAARLGLRVGLRAARGHLNTMRWLRSGGNPDNEPVSF